MNSSVNRFKLSGWKSFTNHFDGSNQLLTILKVNLIIYLVFDYIINLYVICSVESVTKEIESRHGRSSCFNLDHVVIVTCLYGSLVMSIVFDVIGLLGIIKEYPFLCLLNVCQLSIGVLKVVVVFNYLPLVAIHMLFVILSLIFAVIVMPKDDKLFICTP